MLVIVLAAKENQLFTSENQGVAVRVCDLLLGLACAE